MYINICICNQYARAGGRIFNFFNSILTAAIDNGYDRDYHRMNT